MSRRSSIVITAALAAFATFSSHDLAAGSSWANPNDGTWSTAANWNPSSGAPVSSSDSAQFNLGPSNPAAFAAYPGYTVTLTSPVQLAAIQSGGTIIVNTDKVTLSGNTASSYMLYIAANAGETAVVNFTNGGGAGGNYGATIADNGGQATVNLTNGGVSFNDYIDYVGRHAGSVGTVNVSSGSTLTTGGLNIGADGGTGHVTVNGAGSKLQTASGGSGFAYIKVGAASSVGSLAVTNGGAVTTTNLTLTAGSSLMIDGTGSALTATSNGFTLAGAATVSNAGKLNASVSDGTISPGGSLALAGGSVSASGNLTVAGTLSGSGTISGTVKFQNTGTLAMSITSPAAYDHLTLGSGPNPAFAGTFNLTADPSYSAHAGDTFDLLDFTPQFPFPPGSPIATFGTVNLPSLPTGLSWNTSNLYSTGVLSVVPESATLSLLAVAAAPLLRRRRG